MKIAVVTDLLVQRGGAEYLVEVIMRQLPEADLYTLLYVPDKTYDSFRKYNIIQPGLTGFPLIGKIYEKKHKYFLPLYPFLIEGFDFTGYDLVISVSFLLAKNIITRYDTTHLCYCLTPARHFWEMPFLYLSEQRFALLRWFLAKLQHRLRLWDESCSGRPDGFIAISECVRKRIIKRYRRKSELLYPPYNAAMFYYDPAVKKEEFYLLASRLVSYKRADTVIKAFNMTGKKLVITGEGPEENNLKVLAGKNIEFTGYVSDSRMAELYRKAKALIFPGEEDFGITMVNALACGTPVLAYNCGAAPEIIKSFRAGVLFDNNKDPAALNAALESFEKTGYNPVITSGFAAGFDENSFISRFRELLMKMI